MSKSTSTVQVVPKNVKWDDKRRPAGRCARALRASRCSSWGFAGACGRFRRSLPEQAPAAGRESGASGGIP